MSIDSMATAAGSGESPAGSRRLRNGELQRMVAAHLADHAGTDCKPGVIAAALDGRSSGAVSNALAWLEERGAARKTGDRPVTYTATDTTRTMASTTPRPGGSATAPAAPAVDPAPAVPDPADDPVAPDPAGPAGPDPTADPAALDPAGDPATPDPPADAPSAPDGAGAPAVPDADVVDPATAVTAVVEPDPAEPVVRPSGQRYHPRELAGVSDVQALRTAREAGIPVLLYGPPGTGKTSVAEAAFPDLITLSGDGDTSAADLVGEYTQTPDARYVFVDGPLVAAMKQGRALLIDDATLVSPAELAVLYPAMDGRGEITVKGSGEQVKAEPGFYVIAGHNPGVHGAILTDALASRFSLQIRVSTDYTLALELGVDKRAVRVARQLVARRDAGEVEWVPQLRELLAFSRIEAALGLDVAVANLVGVSPEIDRDTVATVVRDAFGHDVAPLALGAQLHRRTT